MNTKFWDDSFICELTPNEKLLFIYLLTNSLTNMTGIYEISMRRIKFDTGLLEEDILKCLQNFEKQKKVFYYCNTIILRNFCANQRFNINMLKSAQEEFLTLNDNVKTYIKETLPNLYKWLETIPDGLKAFGKEEVEVEDKEEVEVNIAFDIFWEAYDKKKDKEKCLKKWGRLTDKNREDIIKYLPAYKNSTPVKQFRKDPATFLNNKSWENEIITNGTVEPEYKVITEEDYKRMHEE